MMSPAKPAKTPPSVISLSGDPSDVPRSVAELKIDSPEKTPAEYHSSVAVKWTFVIILIAQICINFESGAIPSVLVEIKEESHMGEVVLGLVGALPYVGLVAMAPVVGYLLQIHHWQQRIAVISLFANVGALALLAFSHSKTQMLIARVLQGMAQAGFTIYSPIWVDEFASDKHVTLWMSLLQGLGVFGLMLGYLITGYASTNGIKWQYSIMGQGIAIAFIAIVLWLCPSNTVNLRAPPPILQLAVPKQTSQLAVGLSQREFISDEGSERGCRRSRSSLEMVSNSEKSESHHPKDKRLAEMKMDKDPDAMNLYRSSTESATHPPPYWRMKTVKGENSGALIARSSTSLRRSSSQELEPEPNSKKLFHPRTFRTFVTTSPSGFVYEGLDMRLHSLGNHVTFDASKRHKSLSSIPEQEDSNNSQEEDTKSTKSKMPTLLVNIGRLMTNVIYICLVLAISTLFYCVTGIQYWSTKYFEEALGLGGTKVLISFSAVAATAPTTGVFLGGWFIDYMGGYRSKEGLQKTLLICLFEAILSAASGLGASLSPAFVGILIFDWFILFFGGALLPPLTGMVLATVGDLHLRALSSSLSALTINLLGYTSGSFLPGVFTSNFGLYWGMFSIYIVAWFGSITVSVALIYARVKSLEPIQHQRIIEDD